MNPKMTMRSTTQLDVQLIQATDIKKAKKAYMVRIFGGATVFLVQNHT